MMLVIGGCLIGFQGHQVIRANWFTDNLYITPVRLVGICDKIYCSSSKFRVFTVVFFYVGVQLLLLSGVNDN